MADEQKNIIISVSVDNTDAVAGIEEVKTKLDDVSDTPLDKPFKNFKSQIKDATLEAQKLEQQFGKNSDEFRNAAKRVAELKDNYQEFGNSVKAFNPDNKLQSLTTAARGAVGAIQGVTGAMAFLGVESGDAQQAIARLQGLMAFSSALDSIDDIKTAYKDFKNVIKDSAIFQSVYNAATKAATAIQLAFGIAVDTTSVSFKVLRGAIISTGIGALVVVLGYAVNKIIEFNESTDDQTNATKLATEEQDKYNQSLKDEQDILAKNIQQLEYQTQLDILNAQARGASEKELRKIRNDAFNERLYQLEKDFEENNNNTKAGTEGTKEEIEAYKKSFEDRKKANQEYKLWLAQNKVDDFNANKNKPTTTTTTKTKSQAVIDAEAAAKQLKELRDQNELDAIADEFKRRKAVLEKSLNDKLADNEKLKIDSEEKTNLAIQLLIKYNFEIGLIDKEIADKKAADEQAAKDKKLEEEDKAREERLAKERKAAEEEVRIQEEKNRFLQVATDNSINILSAVGNFAKEGSDLQKGVAIASVVIEKAKSIYDVISSAIAATVATNKGVAVGVGNLLPRAALGDPTAIAGIAGLTAYGVKQNTLTQVSAGISTALLTSQAYKSIQSIRNAGQGGGDNGGGQTPNLNNSAGGGAPQIIATQTTPQAIQDVRVTNQGQAPIRAFITDRDLRSNEQRTSFLNNLSTF